MQRSDLVADIRILQKERFPQTVVFLHKKVCCNLVTLFLVIQIEQLHRPVTTCIDKLLHAS